MMTDEQIAKLPRHRKDWLEIWGNQWAPKRVMPGTCEACVWGSGEHLCGMTPLGVTQGEFLAAGSTFSERYRTITLRQLAAVIRNAEHKCVIQS